MFDRFNILVTVFLFSFFSCMCSWRNCCSGTKEREEGRELEGRRRKGAGKFTYFLNLKKKKLSSETNPEILYFKKTKQEKSFKGEKNLSYQKCYYGCQFHDLFFYDSITSFSKRKTGSKKKNFLFPNHLIKCPWNCLFVPYKKKKEKKIYRGVNEFSFYNSTDKIN